MTEYEKAQREIIKALRALNRAAEIIANTPEYTQAENILHASTVRQYNDIITAALILNDAQI